MGETKIYADAGAREWFRSMNLEPSGVQWIGLKQAATSLLDELSEVARSHGLLVDITENPETEGIEKEWAIAEPGGNYVVFALREEALKFGEDDNWRRLVTVDTDGLSALPVAVVFDFLDMKWLGPTLETRDIQVDGAPPVRISAMEELARFAVETLAKRDY